MTNTRAIGTFFFKVEIEGKEVICVRKDPEVEAFDEPTFVRIEVKVLSRLREDAPEFARGFIGIAFRIDERNSRFEGIYLRPDNARAQEQVRRNHSIQYFSYPDYKFDRLREESPGMHETYYDMGLGEWIDMKVVVKDDLARLYLNGGGESRTHSQ